MKLKLKQVSAGKFVLVINGIEIRETSLVRAVTGRLIKKWELI
jgi:hypothetical protein